MLPVTLMHARIWKLLLQSVGVSIFISAYPPSALSTEALHTRLWTDCLCQLLLGTGNVGDASGGGGQGQLSLGLSWDLRVMMDSRYTLSLGRKLRAMEEFLEAISIQIK